MSVERAQDNSAQVGLKVSEQHVHLTNLVREPGAKRALIRNRSVASAATGFSVALWFLWLAERGATSWTLGAAAALTVGGFYSLFFLAMLTPALRWKRDNGLHTTQMFCATATLLVYSHFFDPSARLMTVFWIASAFSFAAQHYDSRGIFLRLAVLASALAFANLIYLQSHPGNLPALITWGGSLVMLGLCLSVAHVAGSLSNYRRLTYRGRAIAEAGLSSTGDAVLILDESGLITSMNERVTLMLGVDPAALLNNTFEGSVELVALCEAPDSQFGGAERQSFIYRGPQGAAIELQCVRSPLHLPSGAFLGEVIVLRDVGATNRLLRQLDHDSRHDALTGALNRAGLLRVLKQIVEGRSSMDAQSKETISGSVEHRFLLILDLDQFKLVNDSCGHSGGDALLREVTNLLGNAVKPDCLVARIGGDEFAVILAARSIESALSDARTLLAQIDRYRFYHQGKSFRVRASGGIAEVCKAESVDGGSATQQNVPLQSMLQMTEHVLANADAACYLAKESGGNCVHQYSAGDDDLARKRQDVSWFVKIREALDEDRFVLMGQRIAAANGPAGCREHMEVLIRMIDRDGELIGPGFFLPAAERFGLMPEIDRYVVRRSLELLSAYPKDSGIQPELSINLSAASLHDRTLVPWVGEQLQKHGVEGSSICFEITETVAIANIEVTNAILRSLQALGCLLALDDVGTGFNSFAYLKALKVDRLKIDGSFVRAIGHDPVDRIMVQSLYNIACASGMTTVAEMVETDVLAEQIREIGIEFLQGFAIHRPEPLTGLLQMLNPPPELDLLAADLMSRLMSANAKRQPAAFESLALPLA
jgi:diguanylate cyclase (GGDEF)-like protein